MAEQQPTEESTLPALEAREALYRADRSRIVATIREHERTFKKPSFMAYAVLFYFAAIIDIVSIIEAITNLTGIGLVIMVIVNIFTGLAFWGASILVGRKVRKMGKASEQVAHLAESTTQTVLRLRTYYARAIRISRKVKVLRKPVRRIALALRKFTRKTRSPAIKMLFAGIFEAIPYLDLFPWQLVGSYLTYRDHHSAYQEGREQLRSLQEALAAQDEEFGESQIAEYESLLAQTDLEEETGEEEESGEELPLAA